MKKVILFLVLASQLLISNVMAQALGPQPMAFHTIALHHDGTVYSWGWNEYGRLGNNSTTDSHIPIKVLKGAYSEGTTYLGDNSSNKTTAVALGYSHSIALATDGTVYSWGNNDHGRLGDNTDTDRDTPVKVLKGAYSGTTYLGDDSGNKITAVALGGGHSVALVADGTMYSWGYNYRGQLGDNSTTDSHIPIKVLKGAYSEGTTYLGDNSSNKIIAVALGYFHSIALTEDGTVYSWGYNWYGQLGDNSTTNSSIPVKVLKGAYSEGTTYLGDNSSNKIIAVALGERHSIALAEDGTVYSWGRNEYGQLGDNTNTQRNAPVKVLKGAYSEGTTYLGDNSSNKIIAVALGGYHSIALAADGTMYSWGYNDHGQLGNNSTTNSSIPVKVLKGAYSEGTTYLGDNSSNKIIAVALGKYHSIALATDGTVYSWGSNISGQLGDNSTTDSYIPVKVNGVGGVGDLVLPIEATNIPAEFGLQKAYPNPFNPEITLSYGLTKDAYTTLLIYDMRGQLIETLQSGNISAGNHSIIWQPINISTGMYIVRLQSNHNTSMQKIVYVK